MRHLKDFVERVESEFKEEIHEYWNESREGARATDRRYYRTEKGYANIKKGWAKRRKAIQAGSAHLSQEERKQVREFYKNRPEGHEVDHIVPVGKGGLHELSNLQYLPKEQHRHKFTGSRYWKLSERKKLL